MASKPSATVALFLICNILFFTFGNACGTCNRSPPPPRRSPPPPPPPKPSPPPPPASCPLDALKLGVCANVLGLVNATVGDPPKLPCCSLLGGLVDLEAALCLCTAIKANILGIDLNLPISLSLVLNYCGKGTPSGFQCP